MRWLVGGDLDEWGFSKPALLLADPAGAVSASAAPAIAQLGRARVVILLRFKARSGDGEPELAGQVSVVAARNRASCFDRQSGPA